MTFEVELNGRLRHVSLERAGDEPGRYRVAVDGESRIVDASRVGDYGLSLLFPGGSRESATVYVAAGANRGEVFAHYRGIAVPIAINGRLTGRASADAGAAADGEQKIAAPMPGRVVRVLVAPGDEVEARQPVVVVEAMKMENELRSPKAGRVREVAVEAGTSVEAGRVLVIVE
jgi:biotin carboxyl carrier protein